MKRSMSTSQFLFVLFLAMGMLSGLTADRSFAATPNVILVMADDLGIGDVSPTNPDCKIKTPQLQAMANEGLTFLDAHTPSSVCTPTRYGLLTGRYNWRSRLARGVLSGTSSHLIPADRPTLGHLMRKAGYHTAMIGKWHLGWDWHKNGKEIDFTKPVKNGPDINGFDQYYGHCGSLDMPPYVWVDTGTITAQPDRTEGVTKKQDRYGWYRKGPIGSDFKISEVLPHLFDKSIDYVKSHAEAAKLGKPFFLYLALPAPHTPIVPVPPFKGASGLNPYADFVMQADHHMGQLLAAVKEAGLDEETLVIFTSDNGCSPEANFSLLKGKEHNPSGKYRGHKADIYEGGHRVPLIARWPGQIKAGQKTDALACLTDVYATLRAVTGQEPEAVGGEDGYSLLPVFDGESTSGRDALISHSIGGSFAIRQGPWKLCLSSGSGGWSAPREAVAKKQGLPLMQLFNLADDVAETNNLVDVEPEKVKELLALLAEQVQNGRCTPGQTLKNDRDVEFLPAGVKKSSDEAVSIRAGMIGLDTSHVIAFTKIFNDANATNALGKVQIVAGYPGGTDMPSSRDRVGKFTEQLRQQGIEIVETIPQLLEKVDVVLLESVDGRIHWEEAKQVIAAKKRLFIDKPVAGSLSDAIAIYEFAKQHDVAIWSASSIRFASTFQSLKNNDTVGEVVGCATWGPCKYQAGTPDMFFYGIHGIEGLFAIMGPGCQSVTRVTTDGTDVITGVWGDGRIGTFRGIRNGKADFGATAFGTKGIVTVNNVSAYPELCSEIAKFFQTGKPPVSADETIEIFAFMTAADESKRLGGVRVELAGVIDEAKSEVQKRLAEAKTPGE